MKLYLITGFLGAGKTTLLKNLMGLFAGQKIKVIVNEFGREGIDGALIESTGASVEEINNGSIFCSCRIDQFEESLERTAAEDPEVILVEASGLSDPTSIKEVLRNPKFDAIDYQGAIGIIDAVNIHKVIETARVCAKQISVSDVLIINKTDMVTESQCKVIEAMLSQRKPDTAIYRTSYGKLKPEWLAFDQEKPDGKDEAAYHLKDVSLRKMTIIVRHDMSLYQLERFLKMVAEDTYRIKGFVELEGRTMLVDCVGADVKMTPYQGSMPHINRLTALAGRGLKMEDSVARAAGWYPDLIDFKQT